MCILENSSSRRRNLGSPAGYEPTRWFNFHLTLLWFYIRLRFEQVWFTLNTTCLRCFQTWQRLSNLKLFSAFHTRNGRGRHGIGRQWRTIIELPVSGHCCSGLIVSVWREWWVIPTCEPCACAAAVRWRHQYPIVAMGTCLTIECGLQVWSILFNMGLLWAVYIYMGVNLPLAS